MVGVPKEEVAPKPVKESETDVIADKEPFAEVALRPVGITVTLYVPPQT